MSRRPVMVFPGKVWSGSAEHAFADAFRALGWGVQDISISSFTGASGGSMRAKLGYRFHRPAALAAFRAEILEQCRLLHPDWLFVVKGPGLDVATLRAVRAMGIRTANFYPDLNFDHMLLDAETLGEYDLFTSSKSFHIPWYRERYPGVPAHHIPHGFAPMVHRPMIAPMTEGDYRCDVLYAGTRSPHKQRLLEELLALMPGLDLLVTGSFWDQTPKDSPLWAHFDDGVRKNCAYAEVIQRARINIAFHFGPDKRGWEDQVSTRTFEIPACGGFMLHIDNQELRDCFEPGVECDVFADMATLAERIRFYLDHPEKRHAILAAGKRRADAEHSFHHRAERLSALMLGVDPASVEPARL